MIKKVIVHKTDQPYRAALPSQDLPKRKLALLSALVPQSWLGGMFFVAIALCASSIASVAQAGPTPSQSALRPVASGLILAQALNDFTVADVSGPSGTPLPVKLKLPEDAASQYGFLMFRRMPPNFELSSGFGTKTYWAVSLHDAEQLEILPPKDFSGAFDLEVLLVKAAGVEPERRVAKVEFLAPRIEQEIARTETNNSREFFVSANQRNLTAAIPEQPNPVAKSDPIVLPAPKELSSADKAIMARGDSFLELGDVASARLLYAQLAKKGLADGALAMARTYDPLFLAALDVRGLQPDLAEAKAWYDKAQRLGSQVAAQRLATLRSSDN